MNSIDKAITKAADALYKAALTSPNIFGEAIREYSFVKKTKYDFGCYSTFDLLPEFSPVDRHSDLGQKLIEMFCSDFDLADGESIEDFKQEFLQDYPDTKLFSNGEIHIAWYWDGDGTLLVATNDKTAINTDCKKDYNWKWVKEKGK